MPLISHGGRRSATARPGPRDAASYAARARGGGRFGGPAAARRRRRRRRPELRPRRGAGAGTSGRARGRGPGAGRAGGARGAGGAGRCGAGDTGRRRTRLPRSPCFGHRRGSSVSPWQRATYGSPRGQLLRQRGGGRQTRSPCSQRARLWLGPQHCRCRHEAPRVPRAACAERLGARAVDRPQRCAARRWRRRGPRCGSATAASRWGGEGGSAFGRGPLPRSVPASSASTARRAIAPGGVPSETPGTSQRWLPVDWPGQAHNQAPEWCAAAGALRHARGGAAGL